MISKKKINLIERPPVIVVLGHIDHGKTTLLDYIRKTNIASQESGSITQHIGAYEISHNKKKMTFIDTPGHEAFSKMRSRGANVADIAILIVAADEGLKAQTIEALKNIKEAKLEMIVAINKIDKPEASAEKVKQQLAEEGVLLEGWGGNISNQEISAKSGKGVSELLDLLSLTAELLELRAEKNTQGQGVVIEAKTDPKIGNISSLLIKNGTIKTGDFVVTGTSLGKIKKIENDQGQTIKEASFSSPISIIGFDSLPNIGDEFYTAENKKEAVKLLKLKEASKSLGAKVLEKDKSGKKLVNLILKADFSGTKEALEKLTEELIFEDIATQVKKSEVGNITENDIKFAKSTNSIIVGFKVKLANNIKKLAEQNEIKIITGNIIYEVIEKIKKEMSEFLVPEIIKNNIGKIQVLAVFKKDKLKIIVGGKVIEGKAKRGVKIDVKRKGQELMTGKLTQLQHNKEDVTEVSLGKECGITFSFDKTINETIETGDILQIYEEKTKQKTL